MHDFPIWVRILDLLVFLVFENRNYFWRIVSTKEN